MCAGVKERKSSACRGAEVIAARAMRSGTFDSEACEAEAAAVELLQGAGLGRRSPIFTVIGRGRGDETAAAEVAPALPAPVSSAKSESAGQFKGQKLGHLHPCTAVETQCHSSRSDKSLPKYGRLVRPMARVQLGAVHTFFACICNY